MPRTVVTILSLAIIVAACTSGPSLGDDGSAETAVAGEASSSTSEVTLPPEEEVIRGTIDGVIDGDTIQAVVDGQRIEIRLIGVSAPEGDECYGDDSRTALASLVTGQTVVLASDGPDTDSAGRALRYVLIEGDPAVLVNAELVSSGSVIPIHSGHLMEAEFLTRGDQSYASGNGMWGTFVCGHPEGGVSADRPQLRIGDVTLISTDAEEPDLSDERFEIVNQSYTSVDVSGWTVRNETGDRRLELPAGTAISAGGVLDITTACGTSGSGVVYWCSESAIWSPAGNTIILQDRLENVVERRAYVVND
ncbi:MAG: lamin tail domain-containing protein [Actinomycetota bacterium]|nr:lamin tail domain-containing protein [Actinomycetota bacterium]